MREGAFLSICLGCGVLADSTAGARAEQRHLFLHSIKLSRPNPPQEVLFSAARPNPARDVGGHFITEDHPHTYPAVSQTPSCTATPHFDLIESLLFWQTNYICGQFFWGHFLTYSVFGLVRGRGERPPQHICGWFVHGTPQSGKTNFYPGAGWASMVDAPLPGPFQPQQLQHLLDLLGAGKPAKDGGGQGITFLGLSSILIMNMIFVI